jgi:hypothetical protein
MCRRAIRVLFFPACFGKILHELVITGEASDILLMRKPGPQKPLHGMFLQLIEKTNLYRWFNFSKSWRFPRPQKWTPNKFFLFVTLPRSPRRMKDCMFLASDFYYWLPVNFLKVYRRRRPSILGNRGRALITSRALCSLPVTLLSSP